MPDPPELTSLHTTLTPKPPCALAPLPSNPAYVAVGTYNLLDSDASTRQPHPESSQARDGAVMLYHASSSSLTLLQTVPLPFAILDLHWLEPAPEQPPAARTETSSAILGAATSTGSIALLKAELPPEVGQAHPVLTWIQTLQLDDTSTVITSFAWRPADAALLYSTAAGEVCVLPALLSARQLARSAATDGHPVPLSMECGEESETVVQHEAEAWIVALDQSGEGVWSGGDDAAIAWAALPSAAGDEEDGHERTSWSSRRIHGAGVTAIEVLCAGVLVTGSYDDKLRVLEVPAGTPGRLTLRAEVDLGGGVWRLCPLGSVPARVEEARKVRLLVCCMYAGARVVELEMHEGRNWDVRVLAAFKEHQSMCYGGTVVDADDGLVLTCSFYDRRLCLWRMPRDVV